jgi:hypothetical protein
MLASTVCFALRVVKGMKSEAGGRSRRSGIREGDG